MSMRTIYIDSEYKCHITDDDTMTAIETDYFDGKCDLFIEGYRLIPIGHSWTMPNGFTIRGFAVFPWRDYTTLKAYQTQYEVNLAEIEDMRAALDILLKGESE